MLFTPSIAALRNGTNDVHIQLPDSTAYCLKQLTADTAHRAGYCLRATTRRVSKITATEYTGYRLRELAADAAHCVLHLLIFPPTQFHTSLLTAQYSLVNISGGADASGAGNVDFLR